MASNHKRLPIPLPVRHSLWIAAAGRCEFRGCNEPVSRDFLTKRTAYVGELAHIVGDSPDAPRGDLIRSKLLAQDERNLMLMCYGCHKRIDRHGKANAYSEADLLAMKREHEARVELVYSSTGVKQTLPVLMTFPIASHTPVIDIRDINHAIIENSKYKRFPSGRHVHIDRSDFDVTDGSPDFWARAEATLTSIFEMRLRPELTARHAPSHLTIAAFAPIPLLMKLGALLGDKMDASVLDLPVERWLWDTRTDVAAPSWQFDVPAQLPRVVAVEVGVSSQVTGVLPPIGAPVLRFEAAAPNRGIIRTEAHLQEFRARCNAFFVALTAAGARVVHIFPATPLCASVELGRLLLPKTLEEVHVWDRQAPTWVHALRLK